MIVGASFTSTSPLILQPLGRPSRLLRHSLFDSAAKYLLRDRDGIYGQEFRNQVGVMNNGRPQRAAVSVAACLRGARDRFDSSRVSGPPHRSQRRVPAKSDPFLPGLLPPTPSD